MNRKNYYILLNLAILVSACNTDDGVEGICLTGSGTVNEYPIEPGAFNEIALFGPVDLRLRQGDEQNVLVSAEPEIYEYISYELDNGLLEIGIKENLDCFETEAGVLIDITVPDIEKIFVLGVSQITSLGDLEVDQLQLEVTGVANIALSGSVLEQVIDVSGQIYLTNFDFISDETRIVVNGAGTMEVTCESILDITVTGSATIRYKGNPQISQNSTGSLTLINAN